MQSQPPLEETDVSRPEAVGEHVKKFTLRAGSKLARIMDLLQRSDGATISNLIEATGWLPHTTRATLTGLRKRGCAITRERIEGGDSVYRRTAAGAPDGGERFEIRSGTSDAAGTEPEPKANRAA
jgi:hypothetical protein